MVFARLMFNDLNKLLGIRQDSEGIVRTTETLRVCEEQREQITCKLSIRVYSLHTCLVGLPHI